MQQSTRRLVLVFGGSLLLTIGVLAACTDNGTTPLPGQTGGVDSGKGKGDGSTPDEEEEETDGSTGTKDAAGVDCGEAPKLRNTENGFFCAFFDRDAGGVDSGTSRGNCRNDEICCNPGKSADGKFPEAYCAAKTGTCESEAAKNFSQWNQAFGTYWECADKNACGGGSKKCCMFTWLDAGPNDKVNLGKLQDDKVPAACNALQAYKVGGARCADDCNANEIQLCSLSDDNCTGSQKCTPFEGAFRDLGACK